MRLDYWRIPMDPGMLWLYMKQCLGVAPFFICMESPIWNHRSCFNFFQWAFPLENALYPSPTHMSLRMLINNPRQPCLFLGTKHTCFSITASLYRSLTQHSTLSEQLFSMCNKCVWTPYNNVILDVVFYMFDSYILLPYMYTLIKGLYGSCLVDMRL